jgi:hypothetical protein
MKRILTLLVLSASLLGAQTADRWIYFFAGAAGNSGYYDNQTVQYRASDDQYATAWVKVLEPSGEYGLIHFEVHAKTRHIRSLSGARYDASGQQLGSSSQPTTWDEIIPDSMADVLFHRLYRVAAPAPPPARY